jgi:flagellar biosynthesis protein FlhG
MPLMPDAHDQAHDLRRLARDCARTPEPAGPRPQLVLLASGKGGAGTTTVAVNLAVALERLALHVLLVDADPRGGSAGLLCGLGEGPTLADVLSGRHSLGESLHCGPAGIDVLPGAWGPDRPADFSRSSQQLLLAQLCNAGSRTDLILIDAGNGQSRALERFWEAADLALLITTPEAAAIIATYALVKGLQGQPRSLPIHALVNLVPDAHSAQAVHARIGRACLRFLGVRPAAAGHLPLDPAVPAAAREGRPFVLTAPRSDAAIETERVAERLAAWTIGQRGVLVRRVSGRKVA